MRGRPRNNVQAALFKIAVLVSTLAFIILAGAPFANTKNVSANTHWQSADTVHETVFIPGSSFNVGEIVYPSAHDFDTTSGIDTCLSLNVPPGDTFTLSLTWEAIFDGLPGAGDLDLYIYLDSACTGSALLTSSFNSNAYTGELLEITPQVRNIGSAPAVAGIRIGRRSGRGNPGLLRLSVLTGSSTFLEHGTDGPPLEGQDGAPTFEFSGPFSISENSATGSTVGTVTATDPQSDPLTFFELEPAAGQTSFQVHAQTGAITVEDPAALDRETASSLIYWIGVTDGISASLVGIAINLSGVNDNSPIALDGFATTSPGLAVAVTLNGTDADIDPAQLLAMSIVSQPANGSVSDPISGSTTSATVVYTPAPGFVGTDTFTFAANDGLTASVPATVTITVIDDPSAVPTPTPVAPPVETPTPDPTIPTATPLSPGRTTVPSPGGGNPPPPTPFGDPQDAVTTPSAPRFLRAKAGDESVAFTWQRPLSDGGVPILGYRIFNIHTAQPTFVTGDVLDGSVLGLENGIPYLFQVRALNAAGYGEGALVGPVTPLTGEPVLLDVQASAHPDDTVTVWWFPPEGDRLNPVSLYTLWAEGGAVVATLSPGDPLIVNVSDLEGDVWHSFRVTASDQDGGLIAAGVSDPVFLPPTLAADYEPLPDDAILVPLTEEARAELQISLRSAAGGVGTVLDVPAVLTIRDGVAAMFVGIDDLHRALTLPPGFSVESVQLAIGTELETGTHLELDIASDLRLSGATEVLIDRTGILLSLPVPGLALRHSLSGSGQSATGFEIAYLPVSLSPGFLFQASVSDEVPLHVSEALAGPFLSEIAGLVQVSTSGMSLSEAAQMRFGFTVSGAWHESQIAAGGSIAVASVGNDGLIVNAPVTCEPVVDSADIKCAGVAEAGAGGDVHYALLSVFDLPSPAPEPTKQPEPTQQPTQLAAPTEPTPIPSPSLVVVEEPTPTVAALPSPGPVATAEIAPTLAPEATPGAPVLPDSGGGGTSAVTWLMSGILGLVVLRGAFYAVGRIRG